MCGAPSSDLSWTWRLNQGRIFMAGQLLNLYPNVALQTYYAEVQGLVLAEIPVSPPPPSILYHNGTFISFVIAWF